MAWLVLVLDIVVYHWLLGEFCEIWIDLIGWMFEVRVNCVCEVVCEVGGFLTAMKKRFLGWNSERKFLLLTFFIIYF